MGLGYDQFDVDFLAVMNPRTDQSAGRLAEPTGQLGILRVISF
jgi:hypothetical protein